MKKIILALCTILLAVSCTKNDTPKSGQDVAEEAPRTTENVSNADGEATGTGAADYSFASCIFDGERDQIILRNESGDYELAVYLYGTHIGYGKYQVFGDEHESHLEGTLRRDGVSCDLKATLFIDCTEERIRLFGSAQLYEPHSVRKSDEILDFAYEGSLVVVPAVVEQKSKQEIALEISVVTEEEYLASYADISDAPDKPKMVFVEGGTFQIGSESSGYHDVTVSSFEIGMTEVTVEQYYTTIGEPVGNEGVENLPAYMNWLEAVVYCNKLSMDCGYKPCYSIGGKTDPSQWDGEMYLDENVGQTGDVTVWNCVQCDFNADGFRLPTKAEWMFAAQGGNKSEHTIYSGSNDINEVGWTSKNTSTRQNVASKKPNELGIYDMSGNLWEWCWDRRGLYSTEPEINPTGPESGSTYRIFCGGGWGTSPSDSKIASCDSESPDVDSPYIGMRLCRSIGQR